MVFILLIGFAGGEKGTDGLFAVCGGEGDYSSMFVLRFILNGKGIVATYMMRL